MVTSIVKGVTTLFILPSERKEAREVACEQENVQKKIAFLQHSKVAAVFSYYMGIATFILTGNAMIFATVLVTGKLCYHLTLHSFLKKSKELDNSHLHLSQQLTSRAAKRAFAGLVIGGALLGIRQGIEYIKDLRLEDFSDFNPSARDAQGFGANGCFENSLPLQLFTGATIISFFKNHSDALSDQVRDLSAQLQKTSSKSSADQEIQTPPFDDTAPFDDQRSPSVRTLRSLGSNPQEENAQQGSNQGQNILLSAAECLQLRQLSEDAFIRSPSRLPEGSRASSPLVLGRPNECSDAKLDSQSMAELVFHEMVRRRKLYHLVQTPLSFADRVIKEIDRQSMLSGQEGAAIEMTRVVVEHLIAQELNRPFSSDKEWFNSLVIGLSMKISELEKESNPAIRKAWTERSGSNELQELHKKINDFSEQASRDISVNSIFRQRRSASNPMTTQ